MTYTTNALQRKLLQTALLGVVLVIILLLFIIFLLLYQLPTHDHVRIVVGDSMRVRQFFNSNIVK